MRSFEVLTPISNGRAAPHKPGSIIEMAEAEAEGLLAVQAIRPIPGQEPESSPVDDEGDNGLPTRDELEALTVKQLDELIAGTDIALEANANKAAKVEALLVYQLNEAAGEG